MKWIYLLIAGALEITWAVAMKMANGKPSFMDTIMPKTPVFMRQLRHSYI